ncbi:MAG: hypothetical protein KKE76_08630 [Gammaproteobacteria bacterium]|nr:hypothetical protein [Gammaproteobacteria bacterium]
MNKNQRMIFEVVAALFVISSMCLVTPVAKADTVSALPSDTKHIPSASSNTSMQSSIWTLGIALIGGAVIFRRKAP